jgi:hypothetical protein
MAEHMTETELETLAVMLGSACQKVFKVTNRQGGYVWNPRDATEVSSEMQIGFYDIQSRQLLEAEDYARPLVYI